MASRSLCQKIGRSSTSLSYADPNHFQRSSRHLRQCLQADARWFASSRPSHQNVTPVRRAATSTAKAPVCVKSAQVPRPAATRPSPSSSLPPATSSTAAATPPSTTQPTPSPFKADTAPPQIRNLTDGLQDHSPALPEADSSGQVDWSRSFHGLSHQPFSPEASAILLAEVDPVDVEVKPDGIIYLPEIKYRRILNKAFGPGGWGLAPRGETIVTEKVVTREYGLVVHGRLVSIARGEQQYFDPDGIPTATEGCKSNALMRCCKDLGIASELWDPVFIRKFMATHSKQVWVEHMTTKRRKMIVMRKDVAGVPYPWKESKG